MKHRGFYIFLSAILILSIRLSLEHFKNGRHVEVPKLINLTFVNETETESKSEQEDDNEDCEIEDWNNFDTTEIPYAEQHEKWKNENITRRDSMHGSKVRLISAYVYPDYIALITSTEDHYGDQVYCRYYDCNRREIINSTSESYFFPLNVIYCARRRGAVYISMSFHEHNLPIESIPLTYRVYQKPVNEVSLCLGPIYGSERKWQQIAEFVEHHRYLGVTQFYFTIFNIDSYSRKILNYYEQIGLADVVVIQLEYEELDWQFHLIETHECYHRSKYHSKWVINCDIDERFNMIDTSISMIDLLQSQSDEVAELNFQVQRIQKTAMGSSVYQNETVLIDNLEFLNFNTSSNDYLWVSSKTIYRPEMVNALTYHMARRQYPGATIRYVRGDIANFRHYRRVSVDGSIGNGWTGAVHKFVETRLNQEFENSLKSRVVERVKYVYE